MMNPKWPCSLLTLAAILILPIGAYGESVDRQGLRLTSRAGSRAAEALAVSSDRGTGLRMVALRVAAGEIFADGFESGDTETWSATVPALQLPSGAVLFLAIQSCPDGWVELEAARGRTVVAKPDGGTTGIVTGGLPLFDQELRQHRHVYELPAETGGSLGLLPHAHRWATFTDSTNVWSTWYWSTQALIGIMDWGDGIDNSGSGHYPLSVKDFPSNPNLWTQRLSGDHTHELGFQNQMSQLAGEPKPYVQLLACRKQ